MLVQLECSPRSYDFSHLTIRQAYLREATLAGVNFAHASFEKCVFAEDFGSILSGAFSPNGGLLAVGTGSGEKRYGEGPEAGRDATFVHFKTSWGLILELVSYPYGRAYEQVQPPMWQPDRFSL